MERHFTELWSFLNSAAFGNQKLDINKKTHINWAMGRKKCITSEAFCSLILFCCSMRSCLCCLSWFLSVNKSSNSFFAASIFALVSLLPFDLLSIAVVIWFCGYQKIKKKKKGERDEVNIQC